METPVEVHTYDQYLAEANAELEDMLYTGTPDPVPEGPKPPTPEERAFFKGVMVALIAVALLIIGAVLLRGSRRPDVMTS